MSPPLLLALMSLSTALAAPPEELAQRAQDRQTYLRVLAAPSDGASSCVELGTSWMKYDCGLATSEALAVAGDTDGALKACDAIDQRQLQGVCVSQVAELAQVLGSTAAKVCKAAGADRGRCQSAALERTIALDEALPRDIGEEALLLAAVRAHVETLLPGARPGRLSRETDRLSASVLAARWQDTPLDPSHCGALEAADCTRLLGQWLTAVISDHDSVCAGERTAAALVEQGAPAATQAGEALLVAAGDWLCTPQDRAPDAPSGP